MELRIYMATLNLTPGTLQRSTFLTVGYGEHYSEVDFSPGIYKVSTPLKLLSGAKLTKSAEKGEVEIVLTPGLSLETWKSMTPVFGQVNSSIKDVTVENIGFDGTSDKQKAPLGKAYFNLIGLRNGTNINVNHLRVHDTCGDVARLTNCSMVRYKENDVRRCGHDGLYADGGYDVEADNNYTEIRTNSAVRLRHVKKGRVRNNKVINKVGGAASCPGFQAEVSDKKLGSSDLLFEGNEVYDTRGPGAWVVATTNDEPDSATGITFRNNTFTNCGNMDSSYHHLPGVGGIVFDCWDKILVENNIFKDCLGYGVLFGDYAGAGDVGSNLTATIRHNQFIGTKKSNTVGEGSGSAIANLKPNRYTVTAQGNYYSGNVRDLYNVVEIPDTVNVGKPTKLLVICKQADEQEITDSLYRKYSVYRQG